MRLTGLVLEVVSFLMTTAAGQSMDYPVVTGEADQLMAGGGTTSLSPASLTPPLGVLTLYLEQLGSTPMAVCLTFWAASRFIGKIPPANLMGCMGGMYRLFGSRQICHNIMRNGLMLSCTMEHLSFGQSKPFLSGIRQPCTAMDGWETYKEDKKAATAEKAEEAERHLL